MKIRKLTVSVLAVFLAIMVLPAKSYAQETESKATEERHLIEYTELTMKRFMEFEEKYNKDYDLSVSTQLEPYREYLDEYEVDSTFGTVSFDKKDFSVTRVIMTMSIGNAEPVQNEKMMFECIAAMSSLEYDETDNNSIELERKIRKTGPASAFDATIEIWRDEIQPKMKEIVQKSKGKPIAQEKLYSGNYDYFLSTMDSEKGIVSFIIAEDREK